MPRKIIVFGGTGSLGKTLIKRLAIDNEVAVFSRDEEKHWTIKNQYKGYNVRFFVGDIRDYSRVLDVIDTYRPDDIRVKQLFERGEVSSAAYKKHTEKKEAYTDFHCSYCSYKDYCHSEQGDMSIGAEPDPQPDHMTHGGL